MDFHNIQPVYSLKDKIAMYDINLTQEELENVRDTLRMRLIKIRREIVYMTQKNIDTCTDLLKKIEEKLNE